MPYEIVMPQLGLTMTEGSVATWLKKTGDWVDKGEALFIVETDKAEMEVESTDSGYLTSIQVELGEKVPVGTVIATLGDQPGELVSKERAAAGQARPSAQSEITPPLETESIAGGAPGSSPGDRSTTLAQRTSSRGFAASPRARRLADELGINIDAVTPARGNRIVEEDVRRFQDGRKATPMHSFAAGTAKTLSRASAIRAMVAKRMTESFQTAPHFYLGVEANATEFVKLHGQELGAFNHTTRLKLSYTDLFLRALAMGLKEHPHVNAYWQNEAVRLRDSIDLGFAVQTPDGLIVPVIRNADKLTLLDLTRQRRSLTEKAMAGKLELHEMEGGSATLSNLGSFGVDCFQAILNPQQSIILATGRIAKRVIVVNDSLEVCPTLVLSLSVDHRVLDGVAAANFLVRVKELIETPSAMLL